MKRQFDEPQLGTLNLAPSSPPPASIQASPCKRLNTVSVNRRFSKKPRLGYDDSAAEEILEGFPYNGLTICDSFGDGGHHSDGFVTGNSPSVELSGGSDINSDPGASPLHIQHQEESKSLPTSPIQYIPHNPIETEKLVKRPVTPVKTNRELERPPVVETKKMEVEMQEGQEVGGGNESPDALVSRPFPCIWLDRSQEPMLCKDQPTEVIKVPNLHDVMVSSSDMRNGSDGVAHETGSQPSDDDSINIPQPPTSHASELHMGAAHVLEQRVQQSPSHPQTPMSMHQQVPHPQISPHQDHQQQQQQHHHLQQHQQQPQHNGFTHMKEGLTPSPLKNGMTPHHRFNGLPPEGTTVTGPDGETLTLEVCPECNKVFKRRVYLQRHMEREHWSTAKVFKCEDCSYETKHQSNLSVHRRIHTGERPYNCGACGQTYTQGHLLKSHIRSRHGGNMEYYNLDKSNSERPYHCGACGQRYTQGHLLKSHIRSRHGGNMEFYNLDKKGESTRGRKSLDTKLDPASLVQQKQEKINSLVAQIERQKMNQMMAGNPSMASFLNASMPPYMNSLRPFMASPLALTNSILGGPRLFAIGNMQSMANTMIPIQAGLPMLNHSSMHLSMENSGGIKVPLKVPEVPSPISFHESGGPKITVIDDAIPQDLTTKKSPSMRSPPLRSPPLRSPSSVLKEVNGAASGNGYNKHHYYHHEDMDGDFGVMKNHHIPNPSPLGLDEIPTKEEFPPKRIIDEKKAAEIEKAIDFTCNGTNHKNCDHALKLRALRKNIVRMLSVLTPDLGVENALDYDSDQVDELLHEVIYSNIDDEEAIKT